MVSDSRTQDSRCVAGNGSCFILGASSHSNRVHFFVLLCIKKPNQTKTFLNK